MLLIRLSGWRSPFGAICAGGAGLHSIWRPCARPKISCTNDYQTVLEGRKELTLNRERAEQIFQQCLYPGRHEYRRHHIIRADTFHLSAVNWSKS